jgi:hypothetical protein
MVVSDAAIAVSKKVKRASGDAIAARGREIASRDAETEALLAAKAASRRALIGRNRACRDHESEKPLKRK